MSQPILSLASFFSIEAREYLNFTFDAAARETVRNVILGLCVVMIFVSLYALYQKYVAGAIVRAIIKAEAHSKETAKTAEELGLEKNYLALLELKTNLSLKKLVRMANEECEAEAAPAEEAAIEAESETPAEPNAENCEAKEESEETELARFYIPEELKYRADNMFNKNSNNIVALLISSGLIIAFGILLLKLLPWILTVIDNMIAK